jgi:hypothetical protein
MEAVDADCSPTEPATTRLSTRLRRTLIVGAIVIVAVAAAIATHQRRAPDEQFEADGYSRLGTVQEHDVWAKVTVGRISVHVPDGNGGDLCASTGDFTPTTIPLCTDAFQDDGSVFVAVASRSTPATIATQDGRELPATILREPSWPYALAVRIASDDSLFGAQMK